MNWKGVMPAITTCFNNDLSIDHALMVKHCRLLLDNGCTGIVAFGSLGKGATLTNFVQLIKLVQAEAGIGTARVRPPRLELVGRELEHHNEDHL